MMISIPVSVRAQDVPLFSYWKYYSDAENSLYKTHCDQAFQFLEERKARVDTLTTKDQWLQRKNLIREKMQEIIRIFPEKTPLNPQVTGVIPRDGYLIEKLVYESQPGYFVTGAIYIPEGLTAKAPAIFYACGHSVDGFRSRIYQHIIINLVKKGFVVLTIDPMGQGERYDYWNEQNNVSDFPVPDHEHSYAGTQCLVTGYSVAAHFIWDVIRGIDYMETRKEIDGKRIGMTGRSGGGNLTAYVGALDERIIAAAPECYITDYEFLLKSIGPQCAEQNLYKFIAAGFNHSDFIIARAPMPTMIISTTRDFFSIQGAMESYEEAKRSFEALDAGDKLSMAQDDAVHTSTRKNREAMYAFFQKYLNNPGTPEDVEVNIPEPETLKVTETGQVVTSLNGETVFSLNNRLASDEWEKLNRSRVEDAQHLQKVVATAVDLSGLQFPDKTEAPVFSGRHITDSFVLEKYLIPGSGSYMLPVFYLEPVRAAREKIIVYFHMRGMAYALEQDSLVRDLLKQGYPVLLADLPGIGSLGPGYLKGDSFIQGISYNQWFAAILAGKSPVGLRAEDMIRIFRFVRQELEPAEISMISEGPIGVDGLHAAAIEKDIGSLVLINSPLSFKNFTGTRFYNSALVPHLVAGTAGKYDLPDLMANLAPRRILLVNPRLADYSFATNEQITKELDYPDKIYMKEGSDMNFKVIPWGKTTDPVNQILLWYQQP